MNKEEMIEEIKKMTVVELADLVKAIEEEFGVSAAAVAAPAAGAAGAAAEEKSSFNVVLKDAGANKIQVIKVVRDAVTTSAMNFLHGRMCMTLPTTMNGAPSCSSSLRRFASEKTMKSRSP